MPSREVTRATWPRSGRFALAMLIFAAALGLRLALLPVEAGLAFLTFYPAVVVAFYLCGIGPAWLLVALSALAGFYWFTPPFRSAAPSSAALLAVGAFLASSALIHWVIDQLKRRTHRLHLVMSQLRDAEARQRDTLEEMNDLYDHAPAGHYSIDAEGRFVRVNDTMLAWLGCQREELINKLGPADFFTAEGRETLRANFPAFKQHGHIEGLSFDLVSRDKTVRHVSLTASAINDAEGRFLRSRSVLYDVTELRRTQLQLQRLSQEQQAMLDNELVGIVKLRDRQAVWANKGMSRIFGWPVSELLGQPARMLYADDEAFRSFGEAAYPELNAGRRYRGRARMCTREGQPLWVDASGVSLSAETGESVWVLADITALENASLEAQSAQARAEEAMRAKSAFLANMSHEIRTPMNAIIGLTHLMTRDAGDALQQDRLRKVDSAARHLLDIINDILDLSKVEAGKLVLEDVEFSRDEMMSRALELVSESASQRGLELVLDTDHLPDRLRGDPTRLAQALINLLSNAVKFTDRGWIRLRGELLATDGEQLHLRFEVQDTGVGIPADRQQALFQPFEQGDSATTRRHGGTGLGLALTRHLSAQMGGECGVSSVPGVGSTFWFTARLGRARESVIGTVGVRLDGLQALLVDDLPESRAAIGDRLRLLGIRVDEAPGGTEALGQVQARLDSGHPYDVLLIDWRMAPLDGMATLSALRHMLGAATPPALLVTADNSATMWQQAREARFDAVLVKPITPSALHDALVRVLQPAATLPAFEPLAVNEAEALLRRHHGGRQVLLVEDNPINQEVGRELLESVGLAVTIAGNGRQAVDSVRSGSFDLVLMDMQMPEMDGLEATRLIRQDGGSLVPIVAMTANAFGEDRAACLAAGMNDHIGKPVDADHLCKTLLRWLGAPAGVAPMSPAPNGLPPRVSDTASLEDALSAIDGMDLAAALRNVGGATPPLARVLRSFVRTYADGLPILLQPPSTAMTKVWRAASHSLRGAGSIVGATELLRTLAELEQGLDAASAAEELALRATAVQGELLFLVAQLRTVLAEVGHLARAEGVDPLAAGVAERVAAGLVEFVADDRGPARTGHRG